MKIVISNMAWIQSSSLNEINFQKIKNDLSVIPQATSQFEIDKTPIRMWKVHGDFVGIPRNYFSSGFIENNQIIDKRSRGHEVNIAFAGELKDDQRIAVDVFKSHAELRNGGILRAQPGWGKTVFCISFFVEMKMNMIVLVHTKFLADQWVKRINTFAPNARIGIIDKDGFEYGEKYDVVIATIQTLLSRADSIEKTFWSSFGILMTDEVHRTGAREWSTIAPLFNCYYRLGVSATPRRKDKTDRIFIYTIGPVIHSAELKRAQPSLRRVMTDFEIKKTIRIDPVKVSRNLIISRICADRKRNELIVSEVNKALSSESKRKLILFSERRIHLEIIKEMLSELIIDKKFTSSFYVGGMTSKEMSESEKSDVILATYQMAREALDIPELNTLFLISPYSDVYQAIGRIMRERDDNIIPIIVDFVDWKVAHCVSSFNKRMIIYKSLGAYKELNAQKILPGI